MEIALAVAWAHHETANLNCCQQGNALIELEPDARII
jgi:hypothetical protein